jgi:general secretion pathway protein I
MKKEKLRKLLNLKICNLQFAICNSPSPIPLPQGEGVRGRAGFTLIEVIVAIAILAISLVMVMQLFSGGLRASRASCDYTRAIVHAKDKMEELSVEPVQDSGDFEDGFRWESEIQPLEELNKKLEDTDVNMLKIKIKISWFNLARQQKSVELVSLKTIEKEK